MQALKHPWIQQIIKEKEKNSDATATISALENLKNFTATTKLKQATYAFMASQLMTKSEKLKIDETFRLMDKNGDGKLSREEIQHGYEEYFGKVMDEEQLNKMFDSVDLDKSGFIEYSEFVIATMNEKQLVTQERLK